MTEEEKQYLVEKEPYYEAQHDEIEIFERADKLNQPVMLKGPTGCGKSRFVEHMAHKLKRPLITVPCNEDTDADGLIGGYRLHGWEDGPLLQAAKMGAIVYLDEIVEARKDVMVLIHPLTDHRRILPVPKLGSQYVAPDKFMLVISYNPGYQSAVKDLKMSTKQRFVGLNFDYPSAELETKIISAESGLEEAKVKTIVELANKIRNLKQEGLEEGASTRLAIYAAQQIMAGTSPSRACQIALRDPITDQPHLQQSIDDLISLFYCSTDV